MIDDGYEIDYRAYQLRRPLLRRFDDPGALDHVGSQISTVLTIWNHNNEQRLERETSGQVWERKKYAFGTIVMWE